MKVFLPAAPRLLLALASLVAPLASRAQTSATRIDPAWRPTQLYQPAGVGTVVQLTGGDFVINGITRAEGRAVNQLARYSPTGQLDQGFAAAIANNQWRMGNILAAPNNQLLVDLAYTCSFYGGVSRVGLTRLQANGQVDASFQAQPGTVYNTALLLQPDGKILVAGWFGSYGSSAASGLVRLNPNGSIDQAFSAQLGAGFTGGNVSVLALQADGRIVVGGNFTTVAGQARPLLARLEASGAPDRSFAPPTSGPWSIGCLAAQPDGRILVASHAPPLLNNPGRLVRLLPSGQPDASFIADPNLDPWREHGGSHTLQVQADGRIVVSGQYYGPGHSYLHRLLPDGSFDPSWAFTDYGPCASSALSLLLLPNGNLVVGGTPHHYDTTDRVTGIAILQPNWVPLPTFRPHIQASGSIADVLVQPDQQVVVTGRFDEINGVPAGNLARLTGSGEVDTAFTAHSRLGYAKCSGLVTSLRLQSDGKLVVGGDFRTVGGQARPSLARLLADGRPDPSYVPSLLPTATVWAFDLDPADRVVATGYLPTITQANATSEPVRLFDNDIGCL